MKRSLLAKGEGVDDVMKSLCNKLQRPQSIVKIGCSIDRVCRTSDLPSKLSKNKFKFGNNETSY